MHIFFFSEMYAFTQTMAQQQGSHPQIFLPPRAPHLQMPKVAVCTLHTIVFFIYFVTQILILYPFSVYAKWSTANEWYRNTTEQTCP